MHYNLYTNTDQYKKNNAKSFFCFSKIYKSNKNKKLSKIYEKFKTKISHFLEIIFLKNLIVIREDFEKFDLIFRRLHQLRLSLK